TKTFTGESFAVFREELIALTEGKTHFRSEAVVKTLDGERRDVIVQLFVEPDSRGWSQAYLALTDISEQKKSENALQSSESQLRSILRVAPTGIALVVDRVLQASNQKLCEIVGYPREELIGQSARMFYRTNEDYEYVSQEQYRQIDLYGTGTIETRWQRKDGAIIDVLLCSTPLNATDISEGVTCTILDMTARKQAERALRDSEENLRTILHSIGDAVIATDAQQRVIRLNPIAEQLTGWDASEATGKNLKEVFNITNAETGLQAEDIVGKALTSGNIVRLSNQTILRSKEGKQYPIADSAAPIKDAGGNTNGAVLVFRDMTEELRTREELQRIQTLESIGILAGGIAHDFNNILMGLFGNIALAKRKLSPDHPSYKNLQNAENSADRARNLTGKLLTFAKGGEPIRDHVSLADLIKEVVGFDLTGSNVKLIFEYPEDLWAADVDKGQIQQVFSNLTTNANQAMLEGGELQISLQNLDNIDSIIQSLAPGKYIKAVVKDNGPGIDENDLGRIFDPYFSTKQAGSGLGLATVYSIIHKHNGQISVTSEPGKGTTFTLLLPAKDSAPPRQKTAEVETTLPLFPTARILVMDDESAIRDLVTELLKNIGYSVATTGNCHEAIAAYKQAREKGEDFDIVILDLTIPGGPGGEKAVKEILQINPEAKVIVASGYAEDPVMSRYAEYGFKGVITKPFSLGELQKVLETTMAS
ncbi:MAG: PAS domain S-box protein, partial [Chloroflexi bacterium]|nr:PAS domain S-box protein [Chloroflexota bacterium]